jgi:hypothetical protein
MTRAFVIREKPVAEMEKASSLALREGIPIKHAVLRDQTPAAHCDGEDLDRLLDPFELSWR